MATTMNRADGFNLTSSSPDEMTSSGREASRDKAAREVCHWFAHTDDYPDLDADGAYERLGAAVRCVTVNSDPSTTDWHAFDALRALMRKSFPHVMAASTFEVMGNASVLITLPGSDASLRPALFMAHQDVVPVVAGTEADWTHGAFSGDVADGFVWGRGTMDIKEMVMGELEAAEYALSHGWKLKRTLYLAFGEDEESFNTGAAHIAQALAERGVTLEYVWDEGASSVSDGATWGAPGTPFLSVELSEKGYVDIELTVRSAGGHSSNPFGGTSLGVLSQALTRVVERPFPVVLSPLVAETFNVLAPKITAEPFHSLVGTGGSDIDANKNALAAACANSQELFPYVTTTIAPTMIEGGSQQPNVMPQDMHAVVNFRLAPGTTVDDVVAHVREAVAGLPVELTVLQGNDASAQGRFDGYGFAKLTGVIGRYFHDPATGAAPAVVPGISVGATDAHNYEQICDTCMRFAPFLVTTEESRRGVHGTDERIPCVSYIQGIRAILRMIEETCL